MTPSLLPRIASGLVFLIAVVSAPVAGADPWTVEDILRAESVGGWTLSPDGNTLVWVRNTVETVEGVDKRVSNLWLSRLDAPEEEGEGGKEATALASWPLTRGRDTVGQPLFSPDGRHLAFLSSKQPPDGKGKEIAKRQVWALDLRGGEAYPLTRFDRPVQGFAWSGNEAVVVVAEESASAWELERKEGKDDAVVVDDAAHQPPVRLFRVPLEGPVRRLTHNRDWIDSLAVSRDGQRAVVTAQQSLSFEYDSKVPPRTYLVDLESGELKSLLDTPAGERGFQPFMVRWAPDSQSFYFLDAYSRHPLYRTATVTYLYHHDLASGKTTRVDLDWPRGMSFAGYHPVADGLLAVLADGVHRKAVRLVRRDSGWSRSDITGTHADHIQDWEVSLTGTRVVYEHSSASVPAQIYAATLEGEALVGERQVSDLNSGWKDKPTGRVEVVHWNGARDEAVEGLLYYPLDDPQPGERRPLIVDIHGGPAAADHDAWELRWPVPGPLFRQKGAYVLQVNYHGSADYGLDWVESIEGHYYELEIPDIEAGVDALIERGLVDAERLGVIGWSNGGILGAELITRTPRYKVASIGAADVEWVSDWANVDFGASFDNYYFGGPPWERLDHYVDKSPFFRLDRVTTPTIIYTGTEDRNVPPHQSWSLFRALQQLEKAPSRLVLFPGEPHGLRQVTHQRRKIEEDLAWFDRYLFGVEEARPEAFKKDSPLAHLLALRDAARRGTAYGTLARGALIPETVQHEGLEVGRFEVTRAQWAAFRPKHRVAPGDENLPITGISFEEAQAYAAWLAERTGRPFRLPTAEEAKKLAAGSGGNTLDRWAGYAPNPDDRQALLDWLKSTGLAADALLKPVGSFPGSEGDDPVFDLDGNAAEWATIEDGQGKAAGASADRPADPRSTAEPGTAYVGLRVVVGE